MNFTSENTQNSAQQITQLQQQLAVANSAVKKLLLLIIAGLPDQPVSAEQRQLLNDMLRHDSDIASLFNGDDSFWLSLNDLLDRRLEQQVCGATAL